MSRATRGLTVAALLGASTVGLGFHPAPAEASATCTVQQVTMTGSTVDEANGGVAISGNGQVVAFSSSLNYTGGNPDGNVELFRHDLATHTTTQLTSTTGGFDELHDPALDADGSVIAFVSSRNLDGENPDGSTEVFRWHDVTAIDRIDAVSHFPFIVQAERPTIDPSGSRIVFGVNEQGPSELYLVDDGGPAAAPLTATDHQVNGDADIDDSGDLVVFSSSADFDGTNPDGSSEVFLLNLVTDRTTALTRGSTPNSFATEPVLSTDAVRVAYLGGGRPGGQNPDETGQVWLHERRAGTTSALTRTPTSVYGPISLSMDEAGTRVAYVTDGDPLGTNPSGVRRLYLRDFGRSGERTTAVPVAEVEQADLDAAGTHVAFVSPSDPLGTNPDGGVEVFVATCSAPPAPSLCDGRLVTVDRARGERPTTISDVILGSTGAEAINGLAGNDRFCGRGGADTFRGGPGNDRAFGGPGDDRLGGAGGADRLDGGAGPDTCDGGPGRDVALRCTSRRRVP